MAGLVVRSDAGKRPRAYIYQLFISDNLLASVLAALHHFAGGCIQRTDTLSVTFVEVCFRQRGTWNRSNRARILK